MVFYLLFLFESLLKKTVEVQVYIFTFIFIYFCIFETVLLEMWLYCIVCLKLKKKKKCSVSKFTNISGMAELNNTSCPLK